MVSHLAYVDFINLPVCKSYTVNKRANLFTHSLEIGFACLLGVWKQLD